MPDRVLYQSGTSVCSQKVRLVLEELRVPWQAVTLDLAKGDQFKPEYRALNAQSVVPTLVENGQPMVESNDIMLHLSASSANALMPAGQKETVSLRAWLTRSLELHQAVNTFTQLAMSRHPLLAMAPEDREARLAKIPSSARQAKARRLVSQGYEAPDVCRGTEIVLDAAKEMDLALRESKYLIGDDFTLADAAVFPFFHRLELLKHDGLWAGYEDIIARWMADIVVRESYATAIGRFHPEATREKFATNGARGYAELKSVVSDRPV